MAGYYDFVLASIPVSLIGIAALLVGVGWHPVAAVPVGAGSSAVLIGHALFVNGPVAPSPAGVPEAESGTSGSAGTGGPGPVSAD